MKKIQKILNFLYSRKGGFMNIYETIFKRKSIRKYDMKSLDLDILKDIERYLENIKPYDLDIKTKTYILNDEKEIEGMFKVKAPHYIAITSEKKKVIY